MSDHDDLVERLLLVEDGVWRNPEGEEAAAAIIALQGERDKHLRMRMNLFNDCSEAVRRAEAAEAEVARLKAAVEHQSAMAQASNLEVLSLKAELDQAVGVIEDRNAELAEAHRVIEPFASFFNKVLEGFTPDYLKRRDPESVAFGWNEGRLYLKDFIRARSFRDGQKTGEKEGE